MNDDFDVVKEGELHQSSYEKGYKDGWDDALRRIKCFAEKNIRDLEEWNKCVK